jgi:hypothetical protein
MKMSRWVLRLFVFGAFILGTAACVPHLGDADKEFRAWVDQLKSPGPAADKIWGFKVTVVFGAGCPKKDLFIFNAGLNYDRSTPPKFHQAFTCWAEGVDLAGNPVSIQRDVKVDLTFLSDQQGWQIDYQLTNDRPLTGWNKVGSWLFNTYIGPILIFLVLWGWLINTGVQTAYAWARIGTGLLLLPYVGIISYACFGTTLAVFLGIGVYLATFYFFFVIVLQRITAARRYS